MAFLKMLSFPGGVDVLGAISRSFGTQQLLLAGSGGSFDLVHQSGDDRFREVVR